MNELNDIISAIQTDQNELVKDLCKSFRKKLASEVKEEWRDAEWDLVTIQVIENKIRFTQTWVGAWNDSKFIIIHDEQEEVWYETYEIDATTGHKKNELKVKC